MPRRNFPLRRRHRCSTIKQINPKYNSKFLPNAGKKLHWACPMMPIYDFSDTGYEGPSFESIVQGFFACGILVVDSKGKIVSQTPAAQKLLGPSSAQILHRSVETLPVPLQSIIHEAQTTGRAVNERQIVLQQPSAPSVHGHDRGASSQRAIPEPGAVRAHQGGRA